MNFTQEYENLTRGEQNQFQDVVSTLLYRCFIVRRSYDKASMMNKISPNYLFIERHFDLVAQYLEFAGIILNKDDENGVIFTNSEFEANKIRLDGVTTLLIYALRRYYEDKLTNNTSTNEVRMDSTALKILLKELSLSTVSRRINAVSIQASLRTLSSYNIICLVKGSFSEPLYTFDILPTIRYVISNEKLNSLYNYLNDSKIAETESSADQFTNK